MSSSTVINISFNQNHSCFTCSTERGFKVFYADPLTEKLNVGNDMVGEVGQVQMLYTSNLLAFVAGGAHPKFEDNTVMIWDDSRKREGQGHCHKLVMEIVFSQPVLSVRLRTDRLVVVLRQQVHIFSFPQPCRKLFSANTGPNPHGLIAVTANPNADRVLLAYPGSKRGSVQLQDIGPTLPDQSMPPISIPAHQNNLACLAFNQDGTLLATASAKGTLIRVFETINNRQVAEFRRGTDSALLYCINFSADSDFLCASSDKGTVHIFALKDMSLNRRSTLQRMGFIGPYVESLWALANFSVGPECPCLCAFGARNTVIAVCTDGTFHKYSFTPEGACHRVAYDNYLEISEEIDS